MSDFLRSKPEPKPAAPGAPPASSAPATKPASEPQPTLFNGVPLELMEFFTLDMKDLNDSTARKINDIYTFLKPKVKSMGELLMEIRRVERKIGAPALTETRYGKVWNWLKLSNRINDLEKQRKAYEG